MGFQGKIFDFEFLPKASQATISAKMRTVDNTETALVSMPYHFRTICRYIRCRNDFVTFNFMMRLNEKNHMVSAGRYAFMDNLPMVWIGFYWFPLFWRYLGLCNATLATFNVIYQSCIPHGLQLFLPSLFLSFIHSFSRCVRFRWLIRPRLT